MMLTIFISLLSGIFIGIMLIYFSYKKFYKYNHIEYKLKKAQKELNNYKSDLSKYLNNSIDLFNNITHDYHKLYQFMTKESKKLLPNILIEKKIFFWEISKKEQNIEQKNIKIPRDYSDHSSEIMK